MNIASNDSRDLILQEAEKEYKNATLLYKKLAVEYNQAGKDMEDIVYEEMMIVKQLVGIYYKKVKRLHMLLALDESK